LIFRKTVASLALETETTSQTSFGKAALALIATKATVASMREG
jgi:hypothetical protein